MGYADAFGYSRIGNPDPWGMSDCDRVEIVEDRLDGKKYYRFGSNERFILEED